MNDGDLDGFFAKCKAIQLSESEKQKGKQALQQLVKEDDAVRLSAEEKFSLCEWMVAPNTASPSRSQAPLYFGTWSGLQLFRVLKPFYCYRVKESA